MRLDLTCLGEKHELSANYCFGCSMDNTSLFQKQGRYNNHKILSSRSPFHSLILACLNYLIRVITALVIFNTMRQNHKFEVRVFFIYMVADKMLSITRAL